MHGTQVWCGQSIALAKQKTKVTYLERTGKKWGKKLYKHIYQ